jgi:hypothetical protein
MQGLALVLMVGRALRYGGPSCNLTYLLGVEEESFGGGRCCPLVDAKALRSLQPQPYEILSGSDQVPGTGSTAGTKMGAIVS